VISIAEPIDADTLRMRHEFLSMPDLRVSVDDVVTLLAVQPRHARLILESLALDGFLTRLPDGRYERSTPPR
jgi:predicted transcriptional regulator of viral defense system